MESGCIAFKRDQRTFVVVVAAAVIHDSGNDGDGDGVGTWGEYFDLAVSWGDE